MNACYPIGTLSNLVMMTLNHMSVELKCRPEKYGQLKFDYQIHNVFGVSQDTVSPSCSQGIHFSMLSGFALIFYRSHSSVS
jgi:hypothetical protein